MPTWMHPSLPDALPATQPGHVWRDRRYEVMYTVDDIKRAAEKDKTTLVIFKESPRDFLDYFNDREIGTNARNLWARVVLWFLSITQLQWCFYLATLYALFTAGGLWSLGCSFLLLVVASYATKLLSCAVQWVMDATVSAIDRYRELQVKNAVPNLR